MSDMDELLAAELNSMRICIGCGEWVFDDQAYCQNCGQKNFFFEVCLSIETAKTHKSDFENDCFLGHSLSKILQLEDGLTMNYCTTCGAYIKISIH